MATIRVILAVFALLFASGLAVQSVFAQAVIDKSRAAEIARQHYGGQLFGSIKTIDAGDGRILYEIRLDNNGRMQIVYVDGQGNIQNKR